MLANIIKHMPAERQQNKGPEKIPYHALSSFF